MNKTNALILFLSGAAVGSVASWYFTKKKYEAIANEEINSVKEVFARMSEETEALPKDNLAGVVPIHPETQDPQEMADLAKDKPNIVDYASKIKDMNYSNDQFEESTETDYETSEAVSKVREDLDKRNPNPYVITPDEFGDMEDYDLISITYYADKILADDNDEVIDDIDGIVGSESLLTFGQYDDDAVFVRNERLQTDFEILLVEEKYLEVLKNKPYLAEE